MNALSPVEQRDYAVLEYVENHVLEAGETIVWKGRPDPARCLKIGLKRGVFGLVFCGFAIFWTVGAWTTAGLMGLFGVPFIVLGSMLASSPLRDYTRAGRIYYAITNQRVLIVEAKGEAVETETLWPMNVTDYQRADAGDGSGDLRFRRSVSRGRYGRITRQTNFNDGFWGVHDIAGADRAVQALQKAIFEGAETP